MDLLPAKPKDTDAHLILNIIIQITSKKVKQNKKICRVVSLLLAPVNFPLAPMGRGQGEGILTGEGKDHLFRF